MFCALCRIVDRWSTATHATTEHLGGNVFTYEEKVAFSCQTGYHVGLSRSEKNFPPAGSVQVGVGTRVILDGTAARHKRTSEFWSPRSQRQELMLASALDVGRAFSHNRAVLQLQRCLRTRCSRSLCDRSKLYQRWHHSGAISLSSAAFLLDTSRHPGVYQ